MVLHPCAKRVAPLMTATEEETATECSLSRSTDDIHVASTGSRTLTNSKTRTNRMFAAIEPFCE